ncbi:hypothetical protein BD309DRAFT_273129 [Dichomitus squalens]|nr:hypothetical protein BD309DRAFT_273129 [Dichomitus squalens]
MEIPTSTGKIGSCIGPYHTLVPCHQAIVGTLRITQVTEILRAESVRGIEVFRAAVSIAQHEDEVKELDVVCKVGWGTMGAAEVQREANLYQDRLRKLQGTVVPRVHGCYVANDRITVLVMEYCGRALSQGTRSFSQTPLEFRKLTVNGLLAIHRAGILHGDFREENIVVREVQKGKLEGAEYFPVIVDFGEAMEHTCALRGDYEIKTNCPAPGSTSGLLQCLEIHDACGEARFYYPYASVELWRCEVAIDTETTVEEVYMALAERGVVPRGMDKERARRTIRETCQWSQFNKWRDERNEFDNMPLTRDNWEKSKRRLEGPV